MDERYAKIIALSTCSSRNCQGASLSGANARTPLSLFFYPWWNILIPGPRLGRAEKYDEKEPLMPNLRTITLAAAMLALATMALSTSALAAAGKPKYYFKISNIESQDIKIIPLAKELLEKEVATRPEFTMDLGDAQSEDAQIAEIRKQGMLGFQVSLRITSLKKDIKPPAPGHRDQQMSIDVKLAIFGHTLPGNKLLFTGDGDASLMGEFSERLKDKEEERFMRTALASAIKQAVSTAVAKLTTAKLEDKKPGKGKKAKPKAKP
jgi:hypothetical protein